MVEALDIAADQTDGSEAESTWTMLVPPEELDDTLLRFGSLEPEDGLCTVDVIPTGTPGQRTEASREHYRTLDAIAAGQPEITPDTLSAARVDAATAILGGLFRVLRVRMSQPQASTSADHPYSQL
ncbi:MAG TPA: hypothetical protein VF809_01310 [Candidatus Saccharimonadales bacterium]